MGNKTVLKRTVVRGSEHALKKRIVSKTWDLVLN